MSSDGEVYTGHLATTRTALFADRVVTGRVYGQGRVLDGEGWLRFGEKLIQTDSPETPEVLLARLLSGRIASE